MSSRLPRPECHRSKVPGAEYPKGRHDPPKVAEAKLLDGGNQGQSAAAGLVSNQSRDPDPPPSTKKRYLADAGISSTSWVDCNPDLESSNSEAEEHDSVLS